MLKQAYEKIKRIQTSDQNGFIGLGKWGTCLDKGGPSSIVTGDREAICKGSFSVNVTFLWVNV